MVGESRKNHKELKEDAKFKRIGFWQAISFFLNYRVVVKKAIGELEKSWLLGKWLFDRFYREGTRRFRAFAWNGARRDTKKTLLLSK